MLIKTCNKTSTCFIDTTVFARKTLNIINNVSFFEWLSMSKINFLDINFDHNETDLYYETRHTGQYIDFTSQTPWELKTT